MSNTVDSNFGKLILMTELATYHWIKEVNSQGSTFDYNSQDIFREHLKLAHSFNYKESIDLHEKSDFRNLVFDVFPEKLEDNIKIYENYKNFFDGFDRNKLMLETYRKVKKSSLTDSELNLEISSIVELMERDDYYKSDFYKDFGFLSINFHLYISIYLTKKCCPIYEANSKITNPTTQII